MRKIDTGVLGKIVKAAALTVLVSFYFFPVGIVGLPESLNTKQIIGVFGILLFAVKCIREHSLSLPRYIVSSLCFALVFSLWCYFSCVYNGTSDYAYAKYFLSFAVWLGGAFGVCEIIRLVYGRVDLHLLTAYLTAACVFQCVCVVLIDNVLWFQNFIDRHFDQMTRVKDIGRLYGIGCNLDSGGVRFCIALVLIAHQIVGNRKVFDDKRNLSLYLLAFFIITIVGNMVARTTSAGVLLSLAYMAVGTGIARGGVLNARQMRFRTTFLVLVALAIGISIYLYNSNVEARSQLRFAFEALFNFVEHGEFTTGSSEVLMSRMWVWPKDPTTWAIGCGLFEWGYFYDLGMQTDIGYCRFTLYCGLIGLFIFALYFVYNASVVANKFRNARLLALLLLSLTFIIWIKVSTDIFQIYALLFCVAGDKLVDDTETDEPEN